MSEFSEGESLGLLPWLVVLACAVGVLAAAFSNGAAWQALLQR